MTQLAVRQDNDEEERRRLWAIGSARLGNISG